MATYQSGRYEHVYSLGLCAGARANDMNMPMRTIAGPLTPAEMKSLASAYSSGFAVSKGT